MTKNKSIKELKDLKKVFSEDVKKLKMIKNSNTVLEHIDWYNTKKDKKEITKDIKLIKKEMKALKRVIKLYKD